MRLSTSVTRNTWPSASLLNKFKLKIALAPMEAGAIFRLVSQRTVFIERVEQLLSH